MIVVIFIIYKYVKKKNHVNHANLRYLRSISFRATVDKSSDNDIMLAEGEETLPTVAFVETAESKTSHYATAQADDASHVKMTHKSMTLSLHPLC